MTLESCGVQEGTPQGSGTRCVDLQCPVLGACCGPDASCDDGVTFAECDGRSENHIFGGSGTVCGEVVCEEFTGACCGDSGDCEELLKAECDGTFFGPGTRCNPSVPNTAPECTIVSSPSSTRACTIAFTSIRHPRPMRTSVGLIQAFGWMFAEG